MDNLQGMTTEEGMSYLMSRVNGIAYDSDNWFVVINAFGILFMHAGFAMLSVGSVRGKNAKEILLKVLLDASFASLGWWATGFALGFGDGNAFCGERGFFFTNFDNNWYGQYFFQYAFAATAATIVSGSVAERTQMTGYVSYSFFLSMWVYPIIAHWIWSPKGWLGAVRTGGERLFGTGCIDYAGCGVIHMLGGIAGLAGSWIEGPRLGRFTAEGKPIDMPGHNTSLILLGDFILWFGWYSFNVGSTGGMIGRAESVARSAVMTTLGGTSGAVSTLILSYLFNKFLRGVEVFDIVHTSQGLLAGLVSITASAGIVEGWAAVIIGAVGGFVYLISNWFILYKLKVDDPLEASALHGFCGLWGLISVGFFAARGPTQAIYGKKTDYGVIMGGDGSLLGAQLIAALVIISWTSFHMFPFFWALQKAGCLRVPPSIEIEGLDVSHHGGHAYERMRDASMGSVRAGSMVALGPNSISVYSGGGLPVQPGAPGSGKEWDAAYRHQEMLLNRALAELTYVKKEIFNLKSKGL